MARGGWQGAGAGFSSQRGAPVVPEAKPSAGAGAGELVGDGRAVDRDHTQHGHHACPSVEAL